MRPPSLVLDVIFAAIVGTYIYVLLTMAVPEAGGPYAAVAVMACAFAAVALRRPGGYLRGTHDDALAVRPRWSLDRVMHADIAAITVPTLIMKLLVAVVAAGVILAVLVPLLADRGLHVADWVGRVVLLAAVAAAVGPDLWRRYGP